MTNLQLSTEILISLPFATIARPLSVLFPQLTVIIEIGVGYWSYLIDYPIYLATDALIPIGLIALSIRMRMEHLFERKVEHFWPAQARV